MKSKKAGSTILRKQNYNKENDIFDFEMSSENNNGSIIISNGPRATCTSSRHDSSDSITAKCGKWSLGKDVENNPPLLEDMGLTPLAEKGETDNLNVTVASQTSPLKNQKIMQPSMQNNINQITAALIKSDNDSEEFFVYKRRKLDSYGDDKFNSLTEELMLHIFKFLPKFMLARCAQVCKRWKRIAFDESLWKRLDLGSKTLAPGVVGRVLLRGTCTLRLAKAEISSPIFCPQLQHLPDSFYIKSKLLNLDLSMSAVSPEALEEIFSICHQLQKVSLEHCNVSVTCCRLLANNKNLSTLNLAMCYGLTNEGILPIITKCSKLVSLNLAWTHLEAKDLNIICKKFPRSLERLNLSGCRNTLTDNHILQLSNCCLELRELDVSDASLLTADCVKIIIKYLHMLEYLAFARCFSITPDAYLELRNMKTLHFLDLYGVLNESALTAIRDNLPNIKVNKYLFSSVARPTVGIRRTSIWGLRVRD